MDLRDQIVAFIQRTGPVLPVQVAKEIRTSLLLSSAMLAELVERGKLKISSLKVGGSPLYFAHGQEEMLERFVENFSQKDQQVFNILKSEGVLRDTEADSLKRVSLRQMKDFAIPLKAKTTDREELFWKFYKLSDDDAAQIIKKKLGLEETFANERSTTKTRGADNREESGNFAGIQSQQIQQSKQTQTFGKKTVTRKRQSAEGFAKYIESLRNFFTGQGVRVLEQSHGKNEIDFIVEAQTPFGVARYYCKAKYKARLTEIDLMETFLKAQEKRLPAVLLSNVEPSKKAKELLNSRFSGILFKKIQQ